MKTVLQRVSEACVTVDGQTVGEIGPGLLVLFGVQKGDHAEQLDYHVKKLLSIRIFADEAGKMNRSVQDIGGGLLIVSQFTLAGDCKKGMRPGFDGAAPPEEARELYETLVQRLRDSSELRIQTGKFGATMRVSLVNDGPVTFILEN